MKGEEIHGRNFPLLPTVVTEETSPVFYSSIEETPFSVIKETTVFNNDFKRNSRFLLVMKKNFTSFSSMVIEVTPVFYHPEQLQDVQGGTL